MGFWSFDSYIGDKRRLAELLGEKEEYEIAVHDKHRDWKVCESSLPKINREIARVEEKIRRKN